MYTLQIGGKVWKWLSNLLKSVSSVPDSLMSDSELSNFLHILWMIKYMPYYIEALKSESNSEHISPACSESFKMNRDLKKPTDAYKNWSRNPELLPCFFFF